jgi:ATP-dependent DNA helicase RecG
MNPEDLKQLLDRLIGNWEGEFVEFKEANDNFSTADIGKYFSALSNEANLHGSAVAWLVFGVRNSDRQIVGTSYREDPDRLNSLKHSISQGTDPSTSFRQIHQIEVPEGRVLMFEIPAAPQGMPIGWNGHYYARNGESLAALSISKLDEIRRQEAELDWSAVVCEGAMIEDLDPHAIKQAREVFARKVAGRISKETVASWDDRQFLDLAKLTIKGKITRTALLLLGRPESTHWLNPHVAELTWKLEAEEQDYEHFHPPFLLETSLLYQRIRNLRLRLDRPGDLIPVEFQKYDQRIVLEALHNCIAHQDYSQCERVLVIERPGELVFRNAGMFYDGTPDDYVLHNRTPTRYRNRFLAEAMVNLRMIDSMGFGIREIMFKGQMARYLPLPDYDLQDSGHVELRLPGRFIDENYSRMLLMHGDFTLAEAMALDRVQKGLNPDLEMVKKLRKQGLIEGRKPNLHVSAKVAELTGSQAQYIRTRRQDDSHYKRLILDYLEQFKEASREDFRKMLLPKLPDALTEQQKENKLKNLLAALKREGRIKRVGGLSNARWRLG